MRDPTTLLEKDAVDAFHRAGRLPTQASPDSVLLASIAISAKRIADMLEEGSAFSGVGFALEDLTRTLRERG